jgi:hypothetical protein
MRMKKERIEEASHVGVCPSCGKDLVPGRATCPGCRTDVSSFVARREEEERQRKNALDKSNFLFFLAVLFYGISFVPLYLVLAGAWQIDFIWNFLGFFALAAALTYFAYRVRRETK